MFLILGRIKTRHKDRKMKLSFLPLWVFLWLIWNKDFWTTWRKCRCFYQFPLLNILLFRIIRVLSWNQSVLLPGMHKGSMQDHSWSRSSLGKPCRGTWLGCASDTHSTHGMAGLWTHSPAELHCHIWNVLYHGLVTDLIHFSLRNNLQTCLDNRNV